MIEDTTERILNRKYTLLQTAAILHSQYSLIAAVDKAIELEKILEEKMFMVKK